MTFVYTLLEDAGFKIEKFQKSSPFASFLPGLSGENGIPMWVFYVNRGQALASFGVGNKDNAMTEFFPADKAYQMVTTQGFRTFLKGKRGDQHFQYEPFSEENKNIQDSMIIADNDLRLTHFNEEHSIQIDIDYYTLPNQPIPGLVREMKIKNLSQQPLEIEVVDGLATMFPAGVGNVPYKEIGNTYKSWFDASSIDDIFAYYYLRGSTEDEAEVSQNDKGNFFVSFNVVKDSEKALSPIFDRQLIFGNDLSLRIPKTFYEKKEWNADEQIATNKVSAAFSHSEYVLDGEEEILMYSIFGQTDSRIQAEAFVKENLSKEKMTAYKHVAQNLAKNLTKCVETKTAVPEFDAYIKQNYLDNGLRGGFPFVFENERDQKVFYLYSRKHGDLERDYNFFSIEPEYYSQGNGNYRDTNQNRRLDVMIEPKIKDTTIRQFMHLIQLDGYNPLALKTVQFTLQSTDFEFEKYGISSEKSRDFLKKVKEGFTPGSIKKYIEQKKIQLNVPFEAVLTDILSVSEEVLEAEFGEGYWSDHWTYNLDLIDSYLSIYPDKEQELFFSDGYRYFDGPASVNPQEVKYTKKNNQVRQYNAVEVDKEKIKRQAKGIDLWVKMKGKIFTTNLYSKLILLAGIKTATVAPFGLGIEMEGGRPGWNDAMNGLPGMMGAGTSELYEVKRLLKMIKNVKNIHDDGVVLPKESCMFLMETANCIEHTKELNLENWKELTEIREQYRKRIKEGLSEETERLNKDSLKKWMDACQLFIDKAIESVESFDHPLVPTYFRFDALLLDGEVADMRPHAVTPFLEGVVKQLKLSEDKKEAQVLYEKVKQSDLYDQKLKMYKTSGSIENEPIELGRAKFFTPGWLENESIFLHMSYKYLLELLKNDLNEEFFEEIKTGLICFTDPKVYGRSILENSSFLASSANPDEKIHGKGFVARLSGSTVEFLNMWIELFIGSQPFTLQDQDLVFHLRPKLSSDFFGNEKQVSVKVFGDIDLTYYNETGMPTYGENGVQPVEYRLTMIDGKIETIKGAFVKGELAEKIRNKEIVSIEVLLE